MSLWSFFPPYEDACRAKGKEPISAPEFSRAVAALCERLGIQIEDNEDGVFLMQVKLKGATSKKGRSIKFKGCRIE